MTKSSSAKNSLPLPAPSLLGKFFLRVFLCLLLWSVGHQGGTATAQAQEIDHPFHNAIRLQDFAEARRLLDERGRTLLTETDSFGMLPLHSAASLGSLEAVKFLIDEGVDVRYISQNSYYTQLRGRAPLHLAVATGNTRVVDLLVEAGADIFARDKNGVTPLHLAVQYGRIRVATRLIYFSRKLSHTGDRNGTTPLHLAARHGRSIIITRLLFLGDKEKITLGGRLQKLLAGETGVAEDFDQRWRTEVVNVQNNFGLSPLHYAAGGGHEEALELLLEQGAEINITDNQGLSPLFLAARNGHEDVVDILVRWGDIDLESSDELAHTPLSIAIMNGHLPVFAKLLNSGADPHTKNKLGMTPLHMISKQGRMEAVLALLRALKEKNSNIDERDNAGNTPLHYATQTGKKDLVEELLKAGADSSLRNKKNETPLDIARELGHDEVLSILR